ncbi:hypothetical protein [Paracoccus jeotgali]|uniref:hypothetical protein n=1 Tax=Paracoccus jeotgali TaxID=2065379 RepID=UPI0028B20EF8|nr:hypothetical protein [Paracoccus jeotgali]
MPLARIALIAHVALLSISPVSAVAEAAAFDRRTPESALKTFLPDAHREIDRFAIRVEALEIRVNRCAPPDQGEREDLFHIWIGVRGIAPAGATSALTELRADWQAIGLHEKRFRRLGNGGINLAAIDPLTGNSFSFDSGFPADPDRYIVGYLVTPCFQSPAGPVAFGPVEISGEEWGN